MINVGSKGWQLIGDNFIYLWDNDFEVHLKNINNYLHYLSEEDAWTNCLTTLSLTNIFGTIET